jgi:hypothetical protein
MTFCLDIARLPHLGHLLKSTTGFFLTANAGTQPEQQAASLPTLFIEFAAFCHTSDLP